MDLLGDIVEKDVGEVVEVQELPESGFPELYKPEKVSSWRSRFKQKQMNKRGSKERGQPGVKREPQPQPEAKEEEESEAQKIHRENLEYMRRMTPEQLARERQELMESLDPKLIAKMLKNVQKSDKIFAEIEGASGTWVGGTNENVKGVEDLPPLDEDLVNKALEVENTQTKPKSLTEKQVTIAEPDTNEEGDGETFPPLDDDDVAPLDYQMAQSIDHMANEDLLKDVHFVRPTQQEDETEPLDINDPEFNEKLHQKYFPDLPKDIDKLKWMAPLPQDNVNSNVDDVTECRFDFKGNLVPPNRSIDSTQSGLHHHSENQHLAGYTIIELAHLARSQFPSQRTIAIRTLGRILYKLGKQHYNDQLIVEVNDATEAEEATKHIYMMFWELVKDAQVIQLLELGSDEKFTKNLSIRNYSIEALWLWKQGGGNKYKNDKQDSTKKVGTR
ncbi:RNA polymerase II-associated protein RBA50 [Nakaseomyces bracarensis]|uniref:RNA polymerase II-associated protein RBA50 n=1 Tax=Nakaseomyces bracarensis TaxID=273131 RepID=A0ABR4NTP3_9SACH